MKGNIMVRSNNPNSTFPKQAPKGAPYNTASSAVSKSSKDNNLESNRFVLSGRLSFPHLYQPFLSPKSKGTGIPKYQCVLVIDDPEQVKIAKDKLVEFAKKNDILAFLKNEHVYKALCKGDKYGDPLKPPRPEYVGNWVLKVASKNPPELFDNRKNRVTEADGIFYSGCRVDVVTSFWQFSYAGKHGISANLLVVQFTGHADPYTSISLEGISDMLQSKELIDERTDKSVPPGNMGGDYFEESSPSGNTDGDYFEDSPDGASQSSDWSDVDNGADDDDVPF